MTVPGRLRIPPSDGTRVTQPATVLLAVEVVMVALVTVATMLIQMTRP